MTFVCLCNLTIPTGAASADSASAGAASAELASELLDLAPRVRADPRGVVWADARGLPALPLATALRERLLARGCPNPALGVASTPIAASVAARYIGTPIAVVPAGEDRRFLAPFSIDALEPDTDLADLIRGTGIDTCGTLAALSQESVEIEFGAEGVALWRLARADDPRLLFLPIPRELPHATLEWTDYALRDPERLLFVVNRLVTSVCTALHQRGQGAERFTLAFALERGAPVEYPFQLSRPNANVRTWTRRLRDELERIRLPGRVTGIALSVDTVRASESRQGDLLDRGFATGEAAEEALARVLDQRATIVTSVSTRHPLLRRRTEWEEQPATLAWAHPQIGAGDTEPALALHLFAQPQAVDVQTTGHRGYAVPVRYRDQHGWHDVVAASGPDCVSGGMWEESYAYELYCCVREDGELVQLGRDARHDRWELHGMWR